MKLLIVFLSILTSTAILAGDRTTAYEVVCKNMSFESDRNKCIQVIRPFNYFDDEAVYICPLMAFDSKKIECLSYIGDKRYEGYEVETCRNATFESEKLRCLKENGNSSTGGTCVPSRELVSELKQAKYDIRQGSPGTADKRLTYLISKIQNCHK